MKLDKIKPRETKNGRNREYRIGKNLNTEFIEHPFVTYHIEGAEEVPS